MEVGFSYLGSCFQTVEAARQEQCQSSYPQSGSTDAGSYVVSCTGTTETGLALLRTDSAGASTSQALGTSYPSCYVGVIGREPFTPGQAAEAFAWGFSMVLSVYLVAWGAGRVLAMIR